MTQERAGELSRKREALERHLDALGSVLVALSGGVDSGLLACFAYRVLGQRARAVTARSAAYAEEEMASATQIARWIGLSHEFLETAELQEPAFTSNPPDRCYHCKRVLSRRLWEVARRHDIRHVAIGATLDDLQDYRPGHAAAREAGICLPLLDAELAKEEVRRLARETGLPNWDRPSNACLASRIPYGEDITPEKLARVAAAERVLHELGFPLCRVRHHGTIARIEVPRQDIIRLASPQLRESLLEQLRPLGYAYITCDLGGYRSGSLNELLDKG